MLNTIYTWLRRKENKPTPKVVEKPDPVIEEAEERLAYRYLTEPDEYVDYDPKIGL